MFKQSCFTLTSLATLCIGMSLAPLVAAEIKPNGSPTHVQFPQPLSQRAGDENLQMTVQNLDGFNGIITALNVTPDSKYLVVGTGDNRINVLDTVSQTVVYSQISEVNDFSNIAISQDGSLMAIAAGNNVDLRRVADGERVQSLVGHTEKVSSMAFSPDGKTLVSVSGGDRTVRVWDVESGKLLATLADNIGPTTSVVFTPDGRQFITGAIGGDRTIKFWDAETFDLLKTSAKQPGFINGLAVTPNDINLVAAVRNFVKIWDLTSGKEVHFTKGPSLEINTIAVSPDSRLVATANKEGNIMLFEIATGKMITTLNGHKGWVLSLAFSPDGDILYSGAEDKTVKIWRVQEK
ncbi:MAG: WD40 repeat domain-containing protein [Synechocystis sp.]